MTRVTVVFCVVLCKYAVSALILVRFLNFIVIKFRMMGMLLV